MLLGDERGQEASAHAAQRVASDVKTHRTTLRARGDLLGEIGHGGGGQSGEFEGDVGESAGARVGRTAGKQRGGARLIQAGQNGLGGRFEAGRIRRRDGARRWRLMQDLDDPEIWTERWQTASWLDHLRLLQRTTVADRAIRDRARAFHRGDAPPRVRHMLERTPDEARQRIEDEPSPVVRAAQTDPHNPGAEGPTTPRLRVN